MNSTIKKLWSEWLRPLLIGAAIIYPLRSAVIDWNYVPSGSMKPTLFEGDAVAVNKLAYDLKVPFTTAHVATWGNPKRGDIVVFYSPENNLRLVKRVVGQPGDMVEMRNESLFINGRPLAYSPLAGAAFRDLHPDEIAQSILAAEALTPIPHAVMALPGWPALRTFGPVVVPEGSYFMMGDNRDNSHDSRYFGMVARERILGKAAFVIASLDITEHWQPRLDRFFSHLN